MCVQLWRTASFLRSLVAHDHRSPTCSQDSSLSPVSSGFRFFFALSPVLFSVARACIIAFDGEYYVCIVFFIIIAFSFICIYKYPFFSFFSFSSFPLFLAVSFTTYSQFSGHASSRLFAWRKANKRPKCFIYMHTYTFCSRRLYVRARECRRVPLELLFQFFCLYIISWGSSPLFRNFILSPFYYRFILSQMIIQLHA